MKLAFYKASKGNFLDKAINVWTGCYGYSHCELVFDGIEKNLCFSASQREGEVRFKFIDVDSDNWVLIDLPFSHQQELDMYHATEEYVGKKYDFKGIFFWFILPIHKQSDDKWWCSEICLRVLGYSNYRLSPNGFAKNFNAPRQPFNIMLSWKKSF